MKVIDLLNKIANGEELPKKIEYCSTNFYYDDNGKDYLSIQNQFNDGGISICKYIFSGNLNDTVEIIEDTPKENKKIEKFYFSVYQDQKLGGREVVEPLETKINEIIDYINKEMKNK